MPERHLAYSTLLIDDDDDIRRMVSVVLAKTWAFRLVGEASDAPEALAMLDDPSFPRPELILLDFLLPNMSGAEAEPELRARAPGAKIVVLTVVPQRCEEVPNRDGCVDKALLPAQLVAALYRIMRPDSDAEASELFV